MEMIIEPEKTPAFSKTQIILSAVVLLCLAAVFFAGWKLGWFGALKSQIERVNIPSRAPYAEATVVGSVEGVVLAERIAREDESSLPKRMEILIDEKTVFAKITQSGPVRISRADLTESGVIWVYVRARPLEETLSEPVDPDLVLPFEEMMRNPRERIKADYIVVVR